MSKLLKYIYLIATCLLCATTISSYSVFAVSELSPNDKADYVVVKKTERKLYLYRGSEILKTYRIALGKQPDGHKIREGDSRTPEGRYILDWRNPNSKFYRSIHISYPSRTDFRDARERGDSPGGAIMVHGQPTSWVEKTKLLFNQDDWTEGCIAVQNHEMDEIWNAVDDGTPIEIIP